VQPFAVSCLESTVDWAQIATSCGFSDQAHLIHECNALVGRVPTQIVLSDFYNL
jgi:AraC-like DNA-binding protein